MTFIDAINEVYGVTPRALGDLKLDASEVLKLAGASSGDRSQGVQGLGSTDVRPLFSHHGVGYRSLFDLRTIDLVSERALNFLLAFDGLVVADPLGDIKNLIQTGSLDKAVKYASAVIPAMSKIEDLLDRGIIRLSTARPDLGSLQRAPLLEFFGVDPELRVFTNFEEAVIVAEESGTMGERSYIWQVCDLFDRFGLGLPEVTSLRDASCAVRDLAQALIALSWQLAVGALDTASDLVLGTPLQRALIDVILREAGDQTAISKGATSAATANHVLRHFDRIEAGNIPNLGALALTIKDAVSVRESDAFAIFREQLHSGLDTYEIAVASGVDERFARASFEDRMNEASKKLRASRSRSHSSQTRLDATKLGIASFFGLGGLALGGGVWGVGAGAGGGAVGIVISWLRGRTTVGGKIAARYAVSLSGRENS